MTTLKDLCIARGWTKTGSASYMRGKGGMMVVPSFGTSAHQEKVGFLFSDLAGRTWSLDGESGTLVASSAGMHLVGAEGRVDITHAWDVVLDAEIV